LNTKHSSMKTKKKRSAIKVETYLIADISTKYITARDGELIGDRSAPDHVASVDPLVEGGQSQGDIFAVQLEPAIFREQVGRLQKFGFSQQFIKIFRHLHNEDIPYVRFDADGGEVTGLPIFDW